MAKKPELSGPKTSSLDLLILGVLLLAILPVIGGFFAFVFSPADFLLRVRDYFEPFFIHNLWWLEILALIFSALFLWGIVWIIVKTNYFDIKKEYFLDVLGKGRVSRHRSLKAWEQIKRRMLSGDQNDWKLAILEADRILHEIFKMSGYLGNRLDDTLEKLTVEQLSNLVEIKNTHQIRDNIANDPTFQVSQDEAYEMLRVYKQAFQELGLLNQD